MSTASITPWNWVIKALANSELIDSATLIGLVKDVPAICEELGKDAREMVSLRILESLFVHGNKVTVDTNSAQNAKTSPDPTELCEDVLRQILHEQTPEMMTELEKEKRDVLPFLIHKRSSLPKCHLEKLKEAILLGSHPFLASLKERSKLVVANVSENTSALVDGNLDAQTTVGTNNLVSLCPGKENNKSQENLLQETDRLENSTEKTIEHTRREKGEMSTELSVEGLDENKSSDHDKHSSSKNLEKSCNDDNVPQDTYREGQDKRVSTDSMKNMEFVGKFEEPKNSIQPNDLIDELEIGTDCERSNGDIADIAAKKEAFLHSQYTLSQDSVAMTDWTEINVCMKCNKGGELLVCSSNACPLQVHEMCLGSAATFENGEFFCPFCAYSRAISKCLELKRKASLARKDLQAFSRVKCRQKLSKIGAFSDTIETNGNVDATDRAKNIDCISDKVNSALAKSLPSTSDGIDLATTDIHLKNENLNQPNNDLAQKQKPPKSKGNGSPVSVVSIYSRRSCKRKPEYTSPAIPSLSRKPLPWTELEEEILKEGVVRFSSENDKGIPWTQILDFGRDVFQKGRTTIDLKDKWRNICKVSPKA